MEIFVFDLDDTIIDWSKNKCTNGNDISYDCIRYDLYLHKLLYL